MDLNKHLEFISPVQYQGDIHVIGVGAVGSRIADLIVRLGFDKIHIYDFDIVEPVNIPNQLYTAKHIGKPKVDALAEHLTDINPSVEVIVHSDGYQSGELNGTIFMCVDSIKTRKQIVANLEYADNVDLVLDGRMLLTDSQAYAADWRSEKHIKALKSSMEFTDEDAEKMTPVSVCGSTLSVSPTVTWLSSSLVATFINFVKGEPISNLTYLNPFQGYADSNVYPK